MINIIWDLDGTLIDSADEIIQCLEIAAAKSGLDMSKQVKPFVIGPPIDRIIVESFPLEVVTEKILKDTISCFRGIYDNSDFEQTRPFPDIKDIVSDTIKFTHHIVTNKPDMPTNKILNKINWTKYITSVNTPYTKIGSRENKLRSKHEIFRDVISEHSCKTSPFFGIGDMKNDCLAAKDNNITAIGVLWGTGTREELLDCCDYLFETLKQLFNFLNGK